MAAALLIDFSGIPERNRNYAWMVFSDPAMKVIHADWKNTAHSCVAMLRTEAGRNSQDPRMATLVGELSLRDDGFRRRRGGRHIATRNRGSKVLRDPVAGELALDRDALACANDPDQQLVVWTAEPGTASHDALRILASWTADTQGAVSRTTD
ncbi:hypothetical protein [Streptomyces sp. NPDC060054]|uniref:MmyB family transcriptional regulator n=1 Tax=unclassified Streptomyces TaxID=2593676 RepID=UPI00093E0FA5